MATPNQTTAPQMRDKKIPLPRNTEEVLDLLRRCSTACEFNLIHIQNMYQETRRMKQRIDAMREAYTKALDNKQLKKDGNNA